jgi:hypothetical protein
MIRTTLLAIWFWGFGQMLPVRGLIDPITILVIPAGREKVADRILVTSAVTAHTPACVVVAAADKELLHDKFGYRNIHRNGRIGVTAAANELGDVIGIGGNHAVTFRSTGTRTGGSDTDRHGVQARPARVRAALALGPPAVVV